MAKEQGVDWEDIEDKTQAAWEGELPTVAGEIEFEGLFAPDVQGILEQAGRAGKEQSGEAAFSREGQPGAFPAAGRVLSLKRGQKPGMAFGGAESRGKGPAIKGEKPRRMPPAKAFFRILGGSALALACLGLWLGWRAWSGSGGGEVLPSAMDFAKETLYIRYTDESLTDYLTAAAVAYKEAEGVRILPQLVSGKEYLEGIYRDSMEEGEAPDLYLLGNDALGKAYLAGLAYPVGEGVCNAQNYSQAALDAVRWQGKAVAYPLFYETAALVYNREYLRQWVALSGQREASAVSDAEVEAAVPATVEQILAIADGFTELPEGLEAIMKWDVNDIFYNYWVVGAYMHVGGESGDDKSLVAIDNPQAVACLSAYQNLNQFFSIEAEEVDYSTVVQEFLDGKLLFSIATTDMASRLDALAASQSQSAESQSAESQSAESQPAESQTAESQPAEGQIEEASGPRAQDFAIAPLPHISGDLQSRGLSVTTAVVINGYSEKKAEAQKFASFLALEFGDELYARTGKLSSLLAASGEDTRQQAFMGQYAGSISLPKMMETYHYWLQLEVLFSKVWNGGNIQELVTELSSQILLQLTQ